MKLVHNWDDHFLCCFSEISYVSYEKFRNGLIIFFLAEVVWFYDVAPIVLEF